MQFSIKLIISRFVRLFPHSRVKKNSPVLWAIVAAATLCFAVSAQENKTAKRRNAANFSSRILIVPLDDRPATTQFAEMIGHIGNAEVVLPPRPLLGTFIAGGKPEQIAEWLLAQNFSDIDAIVLSVDMLAYGGFMTSRFSAAPLDVALRRLDVIKELKRRNPRLPVYAFNTVRRVALSATAANRPFRDKIARWAVLADETGQKPQDEKLKAEFQRLQNEISPAEIEDYLAVRKRNLQINFAALDLAKSGFVDKLLLLQDDAHRYGLHRRDQQALRERIRQLNLTADRADVYNGADEGASVLLSQAVLRKANFRPRVRVVYSSAAGRAHLGDFEDQPIETSVRRQIENSGAEIVSDSETADYTLYVNAPQQTEADFAAFVRRMIADIKNGQRVAIADVLYKVWGGGDARLVETLGREKLIDRVVGYASWGTPGNAIGTVVPQANIYVFARKRLFDNADSARKIEAAQIKFLFHRWVGDYGFHTLVRQDVNRYARQTLKIEVDEFDRANYEKFNDLVAERMTAIARKFFDEHFKNREYAVDKLNGRVDSIVLLELENLQVRLPWARTFEIFMDFDFRFSDWTLKTFPGQKVTNQ